MSKNTIQALLCFDFKGKSHELLSTIDINKISDFENFNQKIYHLLAKQYNFDLYSYEFEVMLSHEIIFKNPTGVVKKCFSSNKIDFEQLKLEMAYQNNIIIADKIIKKYKLQNNENAKLAIAEILKYKEENN